MIQYIKIVIVGFFFHVIAFQSFNLYKKATFYIKFCKNVKIVLKC